MIDCFKQLDLHQQIHRNLVAKGYASPSPIQAQAIPHLLEGRDLLGCAQTGTGKTAAFALPLLEQLSRDGGRRQPNTARVLVLTPTRELASQIADSFSVYGSGLGLKVLQVYGGVGFGPQRTGLREGVDILVACPGRLLDLKGQGFYKPHGIRYLVLDEADRMLDMGFSREVLRLVDDLPKERQTLLFSATMPDSVRSLASRLLADPVEIRVAPESTTAENVEQHLCFVQKREKRNLLRILLQGQSRDPNSMCLVFSRTKHGANRIVTEIDRAGINARVIHGNKSQGARQRALDDFKSGRVRVLVATDVASRGIDVKGVTLVVNYDLPVEPEAYVHRIGRTARAGASGRSVSFCSEEEFKELRQIERVIRQQIPVDREQPKHEEALENLYVEGQSSRNRHERSRSARSQHGGNRRPNRNRARSHRGGSRRYASSAAA